ncbi:MAG: response regulator [Gammaproteobacteria bacterium]|nr:MAG: response regulator [Gammaproteobacteria bacterium]
MTVEGSQDFTGLRWIRREIEENLRQSRLALEDFAEGERDSLAPVVTWLHQIRGALTLAQVHGAAMLAEELEQLAVALDEGRTSDRETAEESLMLGIAQLPAYLDRIEGGQPDIPMMLLPIMNELRAARGVRAVSEASMFAPGLAAQLASEPVVPGSGNERLPERVRILRPQYHRWLADWLRDKETRSAIKNLRGVLDHLSSLAGTARLRRLLDTADALLLACLEGDVKEDGALKLLFGRLDRVLKEVADRGEEAVARDFPASLYRELLYFVSRSPSADPAIVAARQAAEQANSFVTDRAGGLLAAGRELFETVAGVLADDLVTIKDQLDLYMRGDRQVLERLASLVDPIQRMADTLGMVGQGQLRSRLTPRADEIRASVASGTPPSEDMLMTLAWDLLAVESALKSLGDSNPMGTEGAAAARGTPDLSEGEYREHVRSALGQASVELARVREAVDEYLASGEAERLDQVPHRVRTLAGVVSVIGDREVADLLGELGGYLSALREGRRDLPNDTQRESLGDMISGIEIHLDGMLEPTPESQRALDTALAAAESLGLAQQSEDGETIAGQGSVATAADERVETGGDASPASLPAEDSPSVETVAEAEQGELDSEILAIFIEEAREALETLHEQFPRWREAIDDEAALAEVRRAFHTLKGSGRLVGALEIGEFAWALENMLNRVIDQTIAVTPPLVDLVAEAIETLPALIEAREMGRHSAVDPIPLQKRAEALAAGEVPFEAKAAIEPRQTAEAEEAADRRIGEQEEMLEIDSEAEELLTISNGAENEERQAEEVSEVVTSEQTFGVEEEKESLVLDLEGSDDVGSEWAANEGSSLREEESILTPAAEGQAPIQLEEALHEVFVREATGHLEVIERFVERCRGLANGSHYDDDLKRALHTLRGSAHMAEVEPIAEVAGVLEDWVGLLSSQNRRTEQAGLDLLERGHFMVRSMLEVINVPGATLPAWQALVEEVQGLCKAAVREAGQAEVKETAKVPAPEERDEELVGIFVDEARELLEQLEGAFVEWRSRPDDLLPVAQLQRGLHTLKGGARLAGVTAVGDLGHALESLFEGVVEQRIQADIRMLGLCRHALDRLASQIETLDDGLFLPQEAELVDALQAAAAGREWSLPIAVDEVSTSLAEEATEDSSVFSAEIEEASERESAGLGAATSHPSTLLSESQLLTDSELLAESDLSATTSSLVAGEGDATGLQLDSRIIQFPARGRHAENEDTLRAPPPPPEEEEKPTSHERVRVRGDLLDQLVNHAGEVSIYGARLEQQNRALVHNLDELTNTIQRLRDQLRQLENETEAQILARFEREHQGDLPPGFDPLEMDRYSTIQELSRALSETTDDLSNLGGFLQDLARDTETLLQQQGRVVNDLQDGLLRTRMVPVGSRASRLQRVVRQTAQALGKQAELTITGAAGEMDRVILERMMGPLEHLFRNAVVHGIESPDQREAAGKTAVGNVSLVFGREGSDVILEIADDGRGLDREAIRRKAIERGLLDAGAHVDGEDLDAFILEPGFSTTEEVTQVAGRGVGMDVVVNEIKQLGGTLEIDSQPGSGTRFTIRLPFTLAITEALLVAAGEEVYAVPHGGTEGVVRIPREELEACYRGEKGGISQEEREYPVRYLGRLLGMGAPQLAEGERWLPALLVRSGEHRLAVQVDRVLGHRQIVVKSMGAQLASLRWFTGGTILADGGVALILDTGALVRSETAYQSAVEPGLSAAQDTGGVKVMVVDDSITVRKVTSRLLERHNMRVSTARDGVDAITLLQEERPDIVLLDIEMPRMDGFELARHMRNTDGLKDIPIIMITSRTGEKHREHAMELGVSRYLGKPYQESDLLESIYTVLAETES